MTKNKAKDVRAPLNLSNKINIIHNNYTTKFVLCTGKIDIGIQKIYSSHLNNSRIVIADCSVKNMLKKV